MYNRTKTSILEKSEKTATPKKYIPKPPCRPTNNKTKQDKTTSKNNVNLTDNILTSKDIEKNPSYNDGTTKEATSTNLFSNDLENNSVNSDDEVKEFVIQLHNKRSYESKIDEHYPVKYFSYQNDPSSNYFEPQNQPEKSINSVKNDKDTKIDDKNALNMPKSKLNSVSKKEKSVVTSNVQKDKINLQKLKYVSKEFKLMGVTYFKASYFQEKQQISFSVAIINKRSKVAKEYLKEIERQNNIKLDIFIKPILYYYDAEFLYVVYPSLQRKLFRVERSNEIVYKTIKDLLVMYKQLHDKKIALRSLTFGNIFVQSNKLKILRSTNQIYKEEQEIQNKNRKYLFQVLDPLEFNPPELFERGWCDRQSDIWALGTVLFKLLNGTMPWNHKTYDFNLQIKPHYMEPFSTCIPESLQKLITDMLEIDPMQRITIDEVFMNPWVQDQSYACNTEDTDIEKRIKAKMNEQQTGWNWFKRKVSGHASFVSSISEGIKDTSSYISKKVTNLTKKVFLCYDEEDELGQFEKERREFEKKYQFSQHGGSTTNGCTSSRYGARSNYKTNSSNVMTEKRNQASKDNSFKY